MKATAVELAVSDNCLLAYKLCREWKRDLVLTVNEAGKERKLRFPKHLDRLSIDAVTESCSDVVKVGRSGIRGLIDKDENYVLDQQVSRRVLISGSGRCGTQAISQFLDGMLDQNNKVVNARHETLHEFILPLLVAGDAEGISKIARDMMHDIESAPYYALCPDAIHADYVVHLVRDGRRVVQSGMNRGWYDDNSLWNQIKPVFSKDRFENCCHLWRLTTDNMTQCADATFRLEDLVASAQERARLVSTVGLQWSGKELPLANQGKLSSDYTQWTARQQAQFDEICGPMMDRHYPDWRN